LVSFRAWVALAVLVVSTLLAPGRVSAANQGAAVNVVVYVEGADAAAVRLEIIRALPPGFTVKRSPRFRAMLAQAGIKKLVTVLADDRSREQAAPNVARAAALSGADMAIVAHSIATKRGRRVLVLAMGTSAQAPAVSDDIALAPKQHRARRQMQWKTSVTARLAAGNDAGGNIAPGPGAVETTPQPSPGVSSPAETAAPEPGASEEKAPKAVKSAPEPEAAVPAAEAKAEPAARLEPAPQPATFVLGASFDWGNRRFRHTEPGVAGAQAYDGIGMPGFAVDVELYPLASTRSGVLRDIGVTGDFAKALQVRSMCDSKAPCEVGVNPESDPTKTPIDTTFDRFGGGLRARIRAGTGPNWFELGISAGFRSWTFDFADVDAADRLVPAAKYRMLRGGLDTRIPIGRFSLLARADYLYLLSIEPLGNRDPIDTTNLGSRWGVNALLGLGFSVTPWFELRLGADYTALIFQLKPLPVGPGTPGKVIDQYLDLRFGPFVRF
jgi:hypothetical protein